MRRKSQKPDWQVTLAKERIAILLGLAKKTHKASPDRARRYVELARRIGLRYNVRLTQNQKRSFCKKCNSILVSGYSATVETEGKTVTIKCQNCKNTYRYPYK